MTILREAINFYREEARRRRERKELVTTKIDRNIFVKMINAVSKAEGRRVEVVIKQRDGNQIVIRQEVTKENVKVDPFMVEIGGYQ